LWNGHAWTSASDFLELIENNLAEVIELAGPAFAAMPADEPMSRLGSDGKGGLWVWNQPRVMLDTNDRDPHQGPQPAVFKYYDGTSWHDVWTETGLNQRSLQIVRGMEQGAAILAYDQAAQELVRIGRDGSRVISTSIAKLSTDNIQDYREWIVYGRQRTWIRLKLSDARVYENGKLTRVDNLLDALFEDSHQRLWARYNDHLVCEINQRYVAAPSSPYRVMRVFEMANDHFLAADTHGVQHLVLDQSGPEPVIRKVARFEFPEPINLFHRMLFDESNRLWYQANFGTASRFDLPPAFWSGSN
jgi:hypothetical protein